MTTLARFAPALGEWVTAQLDGGWPADALAQTMQERGIAADAANAIVTGFVRARAFGVPPPVDAVELVEPARLRPGRTIAAGDRVVQVSMRTEQPVLAVLNGVLDEDECAELIALARPRLRPSTIVDLLSGLDIVTGLRASFGMFFAPGENALIARLDRRMAALMNGPVENAEGLQVLHYPLGAGSAPHHDFLAPTNPANRASIARSGQRVSTLVAYLNDVPAGGETVFPALGISVSPQRGNAVYFEYADSHGKTDPALLHASRAVCEGEGEGVNEKWVATRWMRAQRFVSAPLPT